MRASTTVVPASIQRKYGPRRRDLTGKRFGRFVVIGFVGVDRWRSGVWRVRCDCGLEKSIQSRSLVTGVTRSCGCWKRSEYYADRRAAAEDRLRTGSKPCGNRKCRQANPQPIECFSRDRKRIDGRAGRCKSCEQNDRLLRAFSIDADTRDALIATQRGRCANSGCAKRFADDHKPSIDHCHRTGRIRGILCGNCNTALGLLSDSPSKITGLLAYAKKHRQLTTM